jgi:hypothetical protein
MLDPALVLKAQELNRDSKGVGECKSTVFQKRVELACILMGCVGHEGEVALAVVEALNPQPACAGANDDDEDEEDYHRGF